MTSFLWILHQISDGSWRIDQPGIGPEDAPGLPRVTAKANYGERKGQR